MYSVIEMYGDYGWWFLDGWEDDIIEKRYISFDGVPLSNTISTAG